MAQTTHNEGLAKLCRVCGQLLSAAGKSTHCTKNSQSLLKSTFGIEVEHDDLQVHPERYCHRCRGVTYHRARKEGLYRHHTEVFQWSAHTEESCRICTHITTLTKGGRKKQQSKKIGRPHLEGSAMRALFIHAQKIAPPQLCPPPVEYAEEQSLPTEELTCPICVNIVERPIQLTSCSSIVCCQCLSQWLNITDDIKCPCCYGDHLKDFDTVKQPSQLFLAILGQLVVICKVRQKKVKLESHSTQSCGSDEEIGACTSATSEPVAVILSRGSDIPLTQCHQPTYMPRSVQGPNQRNIRINLEVGMMTVRNISKIDKYNLSTEVNQYEYSCLETMTS